LGRGKRKRDKIANARTEKISFHYCLSGSTSLDKSIMMLIFTSSDYNYKGDVTHEAYNYTVTICGSHRHKNEM
jgi:hypothetical protein